MRKFIIMLFTMLAFIIPANADSTSHDMELPSESGVVESILYEDTPSLQQGDNSVKQIVKIKVLTGQYKGLERDIDNMLTGNPAYDIPLKKGDHVVLHVEKNSPNVVSADDIDFFIADLKRDNTLIFITAFFFLCLVIVGRKKGVASLISIAATICLMFFVLMPLILQGFSPIISAVLVSALSTIITVYLVGGFNAKSTSAVLGTMLSLIFAALLSMGVIYFARLTGFAGEENMFLYSAHSTLNFKGILAASMIIAALGALMDTSVSIASTINEIYETNKNLTIKQLFISGMNVGRDIIGTMSNTLILVYLGSSLSLVLLSNNIDIQKFFNLNQVATEISSALIGSIAILMCVPITAIISAYLIKQQKQNEKFDFDEINIKD